MSTRKTKENRTGYYYFTFTCYDWLPLFEHTLLYDNIYNWFDILKKKDIYVNAYVIMPNHIHAVVYLDHIGNTINETLGTGKRFLAYEIVDRLERNDCTGVLEKLSIAVSPYEHQKGQKHKVFETSSDIKEIVSVKFVGQKINYIHLNPVRGKWKLVDDYRTYKYSSAGFYEPVPNSLYEGYPVVHYAEVETVVRD